jgi:hypothetical protein
MFNFYNYYEKFDKTEREAENIDILNYISTYFNKDDTDLNLGSFINNCPHVINSSLYRDVYNFQTFHFLLTNTKEDFLMILKDENLSNKFEELIPMDNQFKIKKFENPYEYYHAYIEIIKKLRKINKSKIMVNIL